MKTLAVDGTKLKAYATEKPPRGRPPKPPGDEPKRVAHQHLTDADAKCMKTRDGIQLAYNVQAGLVGSRDAAIREVAS